MLAIEGLDVSRSGTPILRDVSLSVAPVSSTILNVLPARILSSSPAGDFELVVVLGLSEQGTGSRLLARVTRQSWDRLGLDVGAIVQAQVKGVAMA